MKNYALRLPDDVHRRIADMAVQERRSVNAQIITLIEMALDQQESAKAAS